MIAALQFPHLRTHAEYLSFKPRGKRNTIRVYFRHCEYLSISLQRKEGEFLGAKNDWMNQMNEITTHNTPNQIIDFSRYK